jgi:hypothetical protein
MVTPHQLLAFEPPLGAIPELRAHQSMVPVTDRLGVEPGTRTAAGPLVDVRDRRRIPAIQDAL